LLLNSINEYILMSRRVRERAHSAGNAIFYSSRSAAA